MSYIAVSQDGLREWLDFSVQQRRVIPSGLSAPGAEVIRSGSFKEC